VARNHSSSVRIVHIVPSRRITLLSILLVDIRMQFKSLIKLCHGGTVNAVFKTVICHEYCHLIFIDVYYSTEDGHIFTVMRMKPPDFMMHCTVSLLHSNITLKSSYSQKMYLHACFKIFCYHQYVWNFIIWLCIPVYQISLLCSLLVEVNEITVLHVCPHLKFRTT
jgi:hypothetical protein